MTARDHHSDTVTDRHGHISVGCACGWILTGYSPDERSGVDALMQHAYTCGWSDALADDERSSA